MSTMVERVARAIYEANGFRYEDRTINAIGGAYGEWAKAIKAARAAIEAMMEPTYAMYKASHEALVPPADASACWRAMIQAALKEAE